MSTDSDSITANVERAAVEAVGRRHNEFVGLLADLVAVPSINPAYEPGAESASQRALATMLDERGVPSELVEIDEERLTTFAEEVGTHGKPFAGRPNLVATLGRRDGGGRSLLLNSHIDVVGVAGQAWTNDPFAPAFRDGRLYGRGSADAKGSVAAMAAAICVIAELGIDLAGSVTLLSVADEESGGGGTLDWIAAGGHADAAIVGEPTGLAVCPATRSSRRFQVTVAGRSAHPGEAYLGVNAVNKAYRCIEALEALVARLDNDLPHPLWAGQSVQHVFNLQSIHAGVPGGAGHVPDNCVFEMAAGGTAAETLDDLEHAVEDALRDAAAADEWLREHPPVVAWSPRRLQPSAIDADHPLVHAVSGAWSEATGGPANVRALSGVTDMRHLVRYAGIPSVNFGPGGMHVAHGPDEWVAIDDYITAVEVLALSIIRWCGVAA